MKGLILYELWKRLKEEREQRGGYSKGFKIAIWLAPLLFIILSFIYVYFFG